MRAPPPTSVHRCGVFIGREAAAVGWTPEALRHAVDTGRLVRLRPGCFAPSPPDDLDRFRAADLLLARRAVAATLAVPGAVVSHLGAALVLGSPIWAEAPRPCVTTTERTRIAGVHAHRATARNGQYGSVGGVLVTSPARTVVDIAREFGAEAALVVADAALRSGRLDRVALAATLDELGRVFDVAAARQAAALADPRAESPLESRSRWHMVVHRVDPPQPQMDIFTVEGQFLGRTDFYWGDGVVGEVDGSSKYRDDSVRVREKWREQRLEDVDLEVVRWGAQHLRSFGSTAARIRRAQERARRLTGERGWIAIPAT